jgi:hypothetical protein
MPLDELCTLVHQQGAIWFSNPNLLLLEELIRRARKGEPHGRRDQTDVPGVQATITDVRGYDRDTISAGHPDDPDKWRDREAKTEVHPPRPRLPEPGED